MINMPRLDTLTAGGTDYDFARVRLADCLTLVLKAAPGADVAEEVGLAPGLFAPDTEAWANEELYEDWLTGRALGQIGGLYRDVPVHAIRELVEQHGGEHPDQESDDTAMEVTDEDETAESIVTRALAELGITPHRDDDAGNTWLVIGRDRDRQGFPGIAEPYVVVYLYRSTDADGEETTVTSAPRDGDQWHVLTGDGLGNEQELKKLPADRFTECVATIAEWANSPRPAADPARQH